VEKVLTARKVAWMTGRHVHTIYAWADAGYLPEIRFGRTRLFPRDAVRAILEGRPLVPQEISIGERI
jgi:excisionase family DNA binding protein